MLRTACMIALGVMLAAAPVLAQTGSDSDPIVVKMRRGTDSIRLTGVLRQGVDCCAYVFEAQSGQRLTVRESGAAARLTLRYPDGHMDGPGLPPRLLLPASGRYVLGVSPNLMADGAFGRFTLTLTIPPQRITPGLSVSGDRR